MKKIEKKKSTEEMKPYKKTLNGYFAKEGEDFPFFGFPELWFDKTNACVKPGFEIFFAHEFTEFKNPFDQKLRKVTIVSD